MKLTETEAKAKGFTVDSCCYPWFAYKGPRFSPTEGVECFTTLESQLLEAVKALPLDSFGEDMDACDAADFVDHAGDFFQAMALARTAIIETAAR